jgi:hypothetical protein
MSEGSVVVGGASSVGAMAFVAQAVLEPFFESLSSSSISTFRWQTGQRPLTSFSQLRGELDGFTTGECSKEQLTGLSRPGGTHGRMPKVLGVWHLPQRPVKPAN